MTRLTLAAGREVGVESPRWVRSELVTHPLALLRRVVGGGGGWTISHARSPPAAVARSR